MLNHCAILIIAYGVISNIVKYKSTSTINMSSQRSAPRRPNQTGRSSQGRGRGRGPGNRPQQQPPARFKGNQSELQGQIFDCSDYKQADTFVSTLKRISEYIGAHYKHGGDICSSILQGAIVTLVIPTAPTITDHAHPTPQESVLQMIFYGKICLVYKSPSPRDP